MAQHDVTQATTSKSPNKALLLAALDALEQEYLTFRQRGGGARGVRSHLASPRNAYDQLALDLTTEAELADRSVAHPSERPR